jgi:hypothetical protein
MKDWSGPILSAAVATHHPVASARAANEVSSRDFISYRGFQRKSSGRCCSLRFAKNRCETGACWHLLTMQRFAGRSCVGFAAVISIQRTDCCASAPRQPRGDASELYRIRRRQQNCCVTTFGTGHQGEIGLVPVRVTSQSWSANYVVDVVQGCPVHRPPRQRSGVFYSYASTSVSDRSCPIGLATA